MVSSFALIGVVGGLQVFRYIEGVAHAHEEVTAAEKTALDACIDALVTNGKLPAPDGEAMKAKLREAGGSLGVPGHTTPTGPDTATSASRVTQPRSRQAFCSAP